MHPIGNCSLHIGSTSFHAGVCIGIGKRIIIAIRLTFFIKRYASPSLPSRGVHC